MTDPIADDVNLPAEQRLVLQGMRAARELSLLDDRALAAEIAQRTGEIMRRAAADADAQIAAGGKPEPAPRPGTISTEVGTIRQIRPGDDRARALRWID